MNKEQKNKMVPKLRFPEFRDEERWAEITLIDTANKKVKWSFTGGPFGSNLKASDYVSDGIRVIQLQNIGDAEFINDYKIFTSEEKADELLSCNIYPEEIILSKMGDPVGRACLIPTFHSRYVMCSDGIRLVVDERRFNKYFVYTLINSSQFRSLVEKAATGSTRKRIGLDDLKNLPMIVPNNRKEQKQIADCLSSLDDLLTAESQKLDAFKAHKKGLLQQLFPADGETVPKLRFAEFKDSEDWEEDALCGNDIAFFVNEKIQLEELELKSYVSTENLLSDYGGKTTSSKLPSSGSATRFKIKDILLSNIRPYLKKVWLANIDGGASNDVIVIRADSKLEASFLSLLLINDDFINYIMKGAEGVKMPRGDKDLIKLYRISFPKKPEQQKIASCLSSLDDLITAQTYKIEALKLHKNGLMQGLFPVMNEKILP